MKRSRCQLTSTRPAAVLSVQGDRPVWQLTATAKKQSTISLTGTAPGLSATGSFVVKLGEQVAHGDPRGHHS